MVRRSSLIIAASLAVLSTFEPGALCFAAAAPAEPPIEDRFERPRFLKREIKRYVFANTTMTSHTSTSTTPPPVIPVTTLTPEEIAASLASVSSASSLSSAESVWATAHPGVAFLAEIPDTASNTATNGPAEAGSTTTVPPPQGSSTTLPNGVVVSVSVSLPVPVVQSTTGESNTGGSSAAGSPPVVPVGNPTTTPPGAPSITIPVVSDTSHTPGGVGQQTTVLPPPNPANSGSGQGASGQQTDSTGGIIIPVQSETSVRFGSTPPITGAPQPVPTAEPATGATGGVSAGSNPTESGSSSGGVVLPVVPPTNTIYNALTSALGLSVSPSVAVPVVPASITNAEGSLVSNPAYTGAPAVSPSVAVPVVPASITNAEGSLVSNPAYTGAPAVSPSVAVPVVPASITNAQGSLVSNPAYTGAPAETTGVPVVIGSKNPDLGSGVPITASTPAESTGGVLPVVVGASTNSLGQVVSVTPVVPPSGSIAPIVVGSSTNSLGQVVPITASAPVSGSVAPIVVGSSTNSLGQVVPITSTPPASESVAPLVVGSSTNSLGQVVPVTSPLGSESSVAPVVVGSTTNSLGEVVPVTSVPASAASNTPFNEQTGVPNSALAPGAQSTGVVAPSQTVPGPVGPPTTQAAPLPIATASQTYNTDEGAPLTQKPTAYDSMTAQPVGSSIEVASSAPSATGSQDYGPTGLPSGVPLVLYPPTGPVNRPENTELIQIGFLWPLNYDFVWQHEESQRQIFTYLPMGIAYGLNIDESNVTMQTLRAWDTTEDLHYITTLALAWIPSELVNALGLILHTQAERFYHNPNPPVYTLVKMINPALPIRADNATDGGSETGFGASPTGTGTANNGGTIANGINNSSPVKASSVGIGVGVVCGAAAYGAAMFFVARRYKKRRQSHLRSPSMYSSPIMSHHGADPAAGAALMSGGMGERSMSPYYDNDRGPSRGSGRSGSSAGRQQISAPVMAENSLGWN